MTASSPKTTLWQKDSTPTDWVTAFTVGEDFQWDTLLLPHDIEGTRAHADALVESGVLSAEDRDSIIECLGDMTRKVDDGSIVVTYQDEDCHTVIERYLTDHLSDVGSRIHAGRSRNDQVLVALRLFLGDRIREIGAHLSTTVERLCAFAEEAGDVVVPGYTHTRPAMPTTLAGWALGYAELLIGDLEGLRHAASRLNTSPWGSAAGYGVPHLQLPRDAYAASLGFSSVQLHVSSVQLSRGKLELLAVQAFVQIAASLNRLATDIVRMSSRELGFLRLDSEICTGSSIMPQKQNPDVFELIRAGFHRIAAEGQVLTSLPANLTSGYHRDLQLTKEASMRATMQMLRLAAATGSALPHVHADPDRCRQALSPELIATAEALKLVAGGVPFRKAYRDVAGRLDDLSLPDPDEVLNAYGVIGYPGKEDVGVVRESLTKARSWLD